MADNWVGIDIAKSSFDVAWLRADGSFRHRTFANRAEGFKDLLEWLRKKEALSAPVCMEATGTYGLALATFLHREGIKVSVVNPACIKAFGQSKLQRGKTDRMDAKLIAHFCRVMQPALWAPPPPEIGELQALVRRLEELREMHTQEINRSKTPGLTTAVAASVEKTLAHLQEEITALEQAIEEHFRNHPQLQSQRELLLSIPGIGKTTAALLLAENLTGRGAKTARQLAAYAGLTPNLRQSGSSVRGKAQLSKQGNRWLRKALYWPAITAMRHNPPLRAFAERLRRAGKIKMVIIGALMRKLIHQVFGVLKSQKPFNPAHKPAGA